MLWVPHSDAVDALLPPDCELLQLSCPALQLCWSSSDSLCGVLCSSPPGVALAEPHPVPLEHHPVVEPHQPELEITTSRKAVVHRDPGQNSCLRVFFLFTCSQKC